MSVNTEGLRVDSPAIQTIFGQMTDGRTFGESMPSRWREDLKRVIPTALVTLATIDPAGHTDEAIGRAFYDAINEQGVGTLRTRGAATYIAFGSFLRAAAADIGKVDVPGFETVTEMPPSVWGIDHTDRYQALQVWAQDGVHDIKSGVDEQMVYLGQQRNEALGEYLWSSCCGTEARHKDFLGQVMRYKAYLLDDVVPVKVGMLLRIDEALNRGAYYAIGDVVKVSDVGLEAHFYTEWVRGPGSWKTQSLFREEVRRHHVVSESENGNPDPIDRPMVAQPDERDATIARLEAENRRLANDLTSAQRHHQDDITNIGEALIQEAIDRDWCEEYDRVIQRLNQRLNLDLPIREHDYEIRVSGYLRIPFSYNVTVTAGSHDEAEEQVQDDPDPYLPDASTLATSAYLDRYSAELADDDLEFEQV